MSDARTGVGAVPAAKLIGQEARAAILAAAGERPAGDDAAGYDGLMRAQADALHQITKQVMAPGSKSREGVEATMSRFEARLAVTEQSLAALDQRVSERLKTLDGDTNVLAEHLHGLRQRLEKFEEKQLMALAQIRLDVHNLSQPARAPAPLPPQEPLLLLPQETAPAAMDEAANTNAARPPAYLDSARQAAIEAAARVAAMPVKPSWDWRRPWDWGRSCNWRRLWHKKRWLVLGVAAVLVVWFDVYVFAHYQPAMGGIAESPRPAAPGVPSQARLELVRGLRYLNGAGVAVDIVKARPLIAAAALKGDPVAENLMGVFYQTGTGVDADIALAVGWYEKAAGHGNRKAMANLGKLFAGGWQKGTDFAKAADWFARAARFGDVDAAFDLAILYERGLGVRRDMAAAYTWYAIAAAHGDAHAGTRANILGEQLAPGEKAVQDAAVAAFRPQSLDAAANGVPGFAG